MKKIYLFLIIILTFSCSQNDENVNEIGGGDINLHWYKITADDQIENSIIALFWCYSNLGASILNSEVIIKSDDNIIKTNIDYLGFNQNATRKIGILHDRIKNSEEYKLKNSIDIGRYISLLIGSAEHYYRITGVPKTIDEILSKYELKPYKGYVNNSGVSFEHRIIEYSNQQGLNQLFFCTEIDPITKEVLEYETIELMGNGQLKFGLFDNNGNRKNAGNPNHTNAGKPSKCMWCHESTINPLFKEQNNFDGFLTPTQLNDTLIRYRNILIEKQLILIEGLNYANRQEHTQMELSYISFMEPSAERLSLEWDLTVDQVKNRLSSLQTHIHDEFTFLGDLYDRNEVEQFSPYKSLAVSTSVREKSEVEVNYLD